MKKGLPHGNPFSFLAIVYSFTYPNSIFWKTRLLTGQFHLSFWLKFIDYQ
jgi:hypothetical protein